MRYSLALLILVAAARPAAADLCTSNIMIVLDRSCSMQDPPKAGGAQSKWTLAGLALQKLTTKYMGKLNFGLIMFPDQTNVACAQDGPIYVNVGPNHEADVVNAVMGVMPTGPCVTDIKPAFDQVSTDPAFMGKYMGDAPRSFVLFISDGMQTCGGNVMAIAQSVQTLFNNGYDSYIVGFGGAVDPAALDSFAQVGGVPRMGDGGGSYYQADDADALDAALDAIAGSVLSQSEFGSCPGVPCPDGRCFGAGEQCVDGSCYVPSPPVDLSGVAGAGGGTGGSGGSHTTGNGMGGCGCELGGVARVPMGALLAIAICAVWLIRRRLA